MQGSQSGGTSPKQLLDARHLRPRKRFGQNFLTDPRVATRIALAVPHDAYVLEVGGGTGALTAALLERVRSLTTLEIDRDLCEILLERFTGAGKRLRIESRDVLTFDLAADLREHTPPRAVVGNLPYYITTPVLERIFEASESWETAILMVQREYARRLVAKPGSAEYGSLTLFAAHFARVEKLFDVGAAGFYPPPDVSSTVVQLTPARQSGDAAFLLWFIRAAFAHRRKTLVNSVIATIPEATSLVKKDLEQALVQNGFDPAVRAERLTLADLRGLADTLKAQGTTEQVWTTRSIS